MTADKDRKFLSLDHMPRTLSATELPFCQKNNIDDANGRYKIVMNEDKDISFSQ